MYLYRLIMVNSRLVLNIWPTLTNKYYEEPTFYHLYLLVNKHWADSYLQREYGVHVEVYTWHCTRRNTRMVGSYVPLEVWVHAYPLLTSAHPVGFLSHSELAWVRLRLVHNDLGVIHSPSEYGLVVGPTSSNHLSNESDVNQCSTYELTVDTNTSSCILVHVHTHVHMYCKLYCNSNYMHHIS